MDFLTAPTLLEKLKRTDDQEAWNRFYKIYSSIIFGFARKFGFERTVAEDILQETMCNLVSNMPKFEYQRKAGRFSSYLYTIVRNIVSKRVRKRKLSTVPIEEAFAQGQDEIPHAEQFQFFDKLEQKRKETLKRVAFKRVQDRVEPLTWKSFSAFVLDGKKSAEEVAVELGIKNRNTVYQHKNHGIAMLKEEIKKLEQEIGDYDGLDSWQDSDFETATLKIVAEDFEMPGSEVENRVKVIRKALANRHPTDIIGEKLLVITPGTNWWQELSSKFAIGKEKQNQLQLDSNYLSKKHCQILLDSEDWVIMDLNSTNGTFVNGAKIVKHALNDGDIIQLGDIMLLFVPGTQPESSTPE